MPGSPLGGDLPASDLWQTAAVGRVVERQTQRA